METCKNNTLKIKGANIDKYSLPLATRTFSLSIIQPLEALCVNIYTVTCWCIQWQSRTVTSTWKFLLQTFPK